MPIIDDVIEIVQKAGQAIMPFYGRVLDVEKKSDDSPLTAADLAANSLIEAGLKKIDQIIPILSEESYQTPYEQRRTWQKFWLVDPLDGTKDFLDHRHEFTVNVALIEGDRPILGVVGVPALNLTYWAEKGSGAFCDGRRIRNESRRMGSGLIGSDSNFHSSPETLAFFERHGITKIKKFGSSLKICKLAEGEIDVYPRLNGTKEWDTAASDIIADQADCKLIDVVTNKLLIYNKESCKNNHFIASRNDLFLK